MERQLLEESAEQYANDFCSNDLDLIDKYWDIVYDVYIEGAEWASRTNYKGEEK